MTIKIERSGRWWKLTEGTRSWGVFKRKQQAFLRAEKIDRANRKRAERLERRC